MDADREQPEIRHWMALGGLVTDARVALGLTPADLALRWGKSVSAISRIENGRLRSRVTQTYTSLYAIIGPGLRLAERQRFHEILVTLGISWPYDEIPLVLQINEEHLPQQTPLSWGDLMARAQPHFRKGLWEDALPLYTMAKHASVTSLQRAQSLYAEGAAYRSLADAEYQTALGHCFQALATLGGPLTPDTAAVLAQLGHDTPKLHLYGLTVHLIGQAYFRRGEFSRALAWLESLVQLGRECGDQGLQHEGLHWIMRCYFEQATAPAQDGEVWRVIARPGIFVRATAALEQSAQLRAAFISTPGHLYRWQARVSWLRHDQPQAERYLDLAGEVLTHDHPHSHHLFLDRGRAALADGHIVSAQSLLETAAYRAWQVRNPKVIADALQTLLHLSAMGGSHTERIEALCYGIASLLAYPVALRQADGRKTIALCVDMLTLQAQDAERYWTHKARPLLEQRMHSFAPPFSFLLGLHTCYPLNQKLVNRILGAVEAQLFRR